MNWVTFLAKLNRYAAWTSIVVVILFVITGYGMTKQIMDRDLAKYLHEKVLPIPLFVSLLIHGGISMRHAMWRWKIFAHRRADDAFVLLLVLTLFVLFLWLYWT